MAQAEKDDFEKGEADGSIIAAKVAGMIAKVWSSTDGPIAGSE